MNTPNISGDATRKKGKRRVAGILNFSKNSESAVICEERDTAASQKYCAYTCMQEIVLNSGRKIFKLGATMHFFWHGCAAVVELIRQPVTTKATSSNPDMTICVWCMI